MTTVSLRLSCALAALIAGVPGVPPAAAIERVYQQNAASHCQGALPAFAGTLRARPLGVGNEGMSVAFLTCSFPRNFAEPLNRLAVYFTNRTGSAITINCTGVFGTGRGVPLYLPKSAVANPHAVQLFVWDEDDNEGNPLPGPGNVSCAMPPGATMLDTFNHFDVDIGA